MKPNNKNKDFDFNISPKKDNSQKYDYSINNSFNITNAQDLKKSLENIEEKLNLILSAIKEK